MTVFAEIYESCHIFKWNSGKLKILFLEKKHTILFRKAKGMKKNT